MANWQTFQRQLINLEGGSYRDYKGIKGDYEFPEFDLIVDYVQGDPFAAPSRIRLKIAPETARFPPRWLTDYETQIAIADYLTRQVAQVAQSLMRKRGSGQSGNIEISVPSQAILRRSALWIDSGGIEARLTVGLPAFGRRIAGKAAAALLCEDIPQLVERTLKYEALNEAELTRHIHAFKDAEALRSQLAPNGLVAFIAAGACLPRRSGIDERPLPADQADLFVPPAGGTIVLEAPHSGQVTGLGIRAGITLIVGGGYHGKSTLLRAIEQGIYSHVPGDGRQQVVTDTGAFKLRAEDGRSIAGVDISPVINHLPRGRQSQNFSTPNASGSTSQAAGLIEAIEAGAAVVLIDEDTAATNFMIRDHNMQTLIASEKEPIIPFIDKIRSLYNDYGVSTILVMGGSGDYFAVADTVIAMEDYQPQIVTAKAKAIAQADTHSRQPEGTQQFGKITPRAVLPESIPTGSDRALKIKARQDGLTLGSEHIDLRAVEQLVETAQVRAIAQAIVYAQRHYFSGQLSLGAALDCVMADIRQGGLDVLSPEIDSREPYFAGNLAEFRQLELAAAINRLRSLKVRQIT